MIDDDRVPKLAYAAYYGLDGISEDILDRVWQNLSHETKNRWRRAIAAVEKVRETTTEKCDA